jgi:pimeloyl-ACP methyl ester carboxylesterase
VAVLGLSLARLAVGGEPVLVVSAVPYLREDGRASYEKFLLTNLPRAVAISSNGRYGWFGGTGTLADAKAKALKSCTDKGGLDCSIYAEDLQVVGGQQAAVSMPGPLIQDSMHAFVPDPRYIWYGPATAKGVYVWGHGKTDQWTDNRGEQPPPYVRAFNNVGFDIVRFDRAPAYDYETYADRWLREGAADLRRKGWKTVIVGGQSWGAWAALRMLDTPGLVDAVVAVSPGNSSRYLGATQASGFPGVVHRAAAPAARVVVVQFTGDFFAGDPDERAALLRTELRPHVGALLLIDRPAGFSGHGAGNTSAFAFKFANCILEFATGAPAASPCPTP